MNSISNSTTNGLLPMDKSLDSFWFTEKHELDEHRSTPELPEQSEVVIIGAGYAGIATAYNLVKDDDIQAPKPSSVLVLEARTVCSGATGRNGGHLRPRMYGPGYLERCGIEGGKELAEFEVAHLQAIKELIAKEKIDCDFTLTRSCDVWTNQAEADKMKALYEDMVSHQFEYMKDVDFIYGKNAEGVCGIKEAKACATYTAGTMWPYKFILHLTESALKTGLVNLQTRTPVTAVTELPEGGFLINTPRGTTKAKKIVYANNAYVAGLLPEYSANIIPCKGICCQITVPENTIAPLVNNSYIIRTPDGIGLDYLIPRADGSIVVGGASQEFKNHKDQWYNNIDDSILIDSAKDYYTNYMQRTFRGWDDTGAKVNKIWTGVMGYSSDSNPHIGFIPEKPNQMILAGFNGHGMPVIWIGAKGLARMIRTGESYEDVKLPALLKTSAARIEKARNGPEGGDILNAGTNHTVSLKRK